MKSTSKAVLWFRVKARDQSKGTYEVQWATPDKKHYNTGVFSGAMTKMFTKELQRLGYQEVL